MRTFATATELHAYRMWFWAAFSLSFLLMGLLLPGAVVVWSIGWAFAFGAGVSPFWLLLAYPVVIGMAWLATRTNPERPGPQGTLCGASWGLALFALLVVGMLISASRGKVATRAISGVSPAPLPSATVSMAALSQHSEAA